MRAVPLLSMCDRRPAPCLGDTDPPLLVQVVGIGVSG
jgi:hypothetical protein